MWDERRERTSYRNGPFYTLGTPMYLDFGTPEYPGKVAYFNAVLMEHFQKYFFKIGSHLDPAQILNLDRHSIPGFHIFPPHKTGSYFFGRMHEDIQWKNFNFEKGWDGQQSAEKITQNAEDQFSFTYVVKLPTAGGGLYVGPHREYYPYEENALYIHSGQFLHAIAPTPGPMLPFDYRITLQGHGFIKDGVRYLYW